MKFARALGAGILLVALASAAARPAFGCSVCVQRRVTLFGVTLSALDDCRDAREGELGTTTCQLVVVQGAQGMDCVVVTTGSGGGGTSGGSGGDCTIDQAELCPPSCGVCHRV